MTKLNSEARKAVIIEMTGTSRSFLIARKVRITRIANFQKTEFYSLDGILFYTIGAINKQPTRGQRSINIKGEWYNLRWED